jgi:hypothetical protein
MAPQTHTRYRVQRLIRMGEWLERHGASIITAFDCIDEAHDVLLEAEDTDTVMYAAGKMSAPLRSLMLSCAELRHDRWNVQRGKDVTLHHPMASPENEWEVVIEAPKPQIESNEN